MATIKKDALYSGKWRLRDGRTFEVDPSDIPWYEHRMREFHEAGLPIPMTWEHQPSVKPGSPEAIAEHAKLCLGHTVDVANNNGVLEIKADVPNDDDRKRLPSIKYVSPYIEYDYTDQTGKTWPGPSITHVAVTPNPVQHLQRPFALSNSRDPMAIWDGGVALAFDKQDQDSDQDPGAEEATEAESSEEGADPDQDGDAGQAVGDQDADNQDDNQDNLPPPDESYEDDGSSPDNSLFGNMDDNQDDNQVDNQTPPPDEDDEGDNEPEPELTGSPSKLNRVQGLLLKHAGLALPGDTDHTNFLDRLETALLTKRAADPDFDPATDGGGDQYGMSSRPMETTPPVVMSQTKKGPVAMSQQQQTRLQMLESKMLETSRRDLTARVDRLLRTRRISTDIHKGLRNELKGVALSFSDSGDLKGGSLLVRIQAYEALPESHLSETRFTGESDVSEVPLSLDGGETTTDTEKERTERRRQISKLAAGVK